MDNVAASTTRRCSVIYVLVTAHPDDESLFFLPTIMNLCKRQQQTAEWTTGSRYTSATSTSELLWLLCLTTGDYNGLGSIRSKELTNVCEKLLPFHNVILLNIQRIFSDHPNHPWPISAASTYIQDTLAAQMQQKDVFTEKIVFITFDEGGVSGHNNHRDTYYVIRQLQHFSTRQQPSEALDVSAQRATLDRPNEFLANTVIECWFLKTVHNPLRKYIPVYEWSLLIFVIICHISRKLVFHPKHLASDWYTFGSDPPPNTLKKNDSVDLIIFRLHDPFLSWNAMALHASQFVWYRRLFVIFSCYTYVNRLRRYCHSDLGGALTAVSIKLPKINADSQKIM